MAPQGMVEARGTGERLARWFAGSTAALTVAVMAHGTFALWTAEIAEAGVATATPASSTSTR